MRVFSAGGSAQRPSRTVRRKTSVANRMTPRIGSLRAISRSWNATDGLRRGCESRASSKINVRARRSGPGTRVTSETGHAGDAPRPRIPATLHTAHTNDSCSNGPALPASPYRHRNTPGPESWHCRNGLARCRSMWPRARGRRKSLDASPTSRLAKPQPRLPSHLSRRRRAGTPDGRKSPIRGCVLAFNPRAGWVVQAPCARFLSSRTNEEPIS